MSEATAPSKRKATESTSNQTQPQTTHFTTRNPPWTYFKLQLIPQPGTTTTTTTPLDPLTARTYLTSALSQFLGLTGTAIPIDILKIESTTTTTKQTPNSSSVWIRVPREDGAAVVWALSSWIGGGGIKSGGAAVAAASAGTANVAWRVCAKGNFLGAIVEGSGGDLFS